MPSVASTSFFLKPACLARPNQRGRRCIARKLAGPTTQNRSLDAEYDGLLVFRVPAAHAIAAAALRGVQRLVRANLERLREIVRGGRELCVQRGDADADRDVDSARLAEVVLTNAFAQPHRELIRARCRRVRKQQRELL